MFLLRRREAAHHQGEDDSRGHRRQLWQHSEETTISQFKKKTMVLVFFENNKTHTSPKCVIIARDRLTLDTAPLVPFINGLLPVPPPVRITLPLVHVRYDALTPPPVRPAPPTAHLPPVPHFPPLPPTPSPPPFTTGDSSRVPVVM